LNGYYDTIEAAKLLGVPAATIRSWIKRDQLPRGQMIGGRLRWTKRQLINARDAVRATPSTHTSVVTDAFCGCGSQASATPGQAGFVMLQCSNCGATMAIETAGQYVRRMEPDSLDIAPTGTNEEILASRAAVFAARTSKGSPLVYFIRLGPYVKIGTSVDVLSRIGTLSLAAGNLLVVLPGGYDVEHQTHVRFARLRAFREWFYLQDELLSYVGELQRDLVERYTSDVA
jgi:hypothetical protein